MPGGKTDPIRAGRPVINVIVNPKAGGFRRGRLETILERAEVRANLHETGYRGHARLLVRDMPADIPVYVAGGDGTINEVVNGLMDTRKLGRQTPPIGIIPSGTANVLAREIRMTTRVSDIVAYLKSPSDIEVVPGMSGDCAFMLMTGAGPDAETVANVSPQAKALFGKYAYIWQGMRTSLRGQGDMINVRLGDEMYQVAGVIVTRACHYGGPFVLSECAGLQQPGLVVVMLRSGKVRDLVRYALSLIRGRLERELDVEVVSTSVVTISCADSKRGMQVQIDGDHHGRLPCQIGLAPHAVRLLVPGQFKYIQRA